MASDVKLPPRWDYGPEYRLAWVYRSNITTALYITHSLVDSGALKTYLENQLRPEQRAAIGVRTEAEWIELAHAACNDLAEYRKKLSASEARCERMRGILRRFIGDFENRARSSPEAQAMAGIPEHVIARRSVAAEAWWARSMRDARTALSADAAEQPKEQPVESAKKLAARLGMAVREHDPAEAFGVAAPMTPIATAGGEIPPLPMGSQESFYGRPADEYSRGNWISIAEAHRRMAVDYHSRLTSQQAELEAAVEEQHAARIRAEKATESAWQANDRAEKAEAELARVMAYLRALVESLPDVDDIPEMENRWAQAGEGYRPPWYRAARDAAKLLGDPDR